MIIKALCDKARANIMNEEKLKKFFFYALEPDKDVNSPQSYAMVLEV